MPEPKRNESKQGYLKRCTNELIENEGKKPDQAFAQCNSMWEQSKKAEASELRHDLELTMPLELARGDGNGEITGFLINAYTGQIVDLGFWGKFIFDVKGMEARNQMPVLREHMRDRIVGSSTKFWKDKSNAYLQGKFSEVTQDGQEVRQLASEGFPWQASVGISPVEIKVLRNDKEKAKVNGMEVEGPLEIWTKSRIKETSFVSLGADDDTAGIAISLSNSCPVPVQVEYSQLSTQAEGEKMEKQEMLTSLKEQGLSIEELSEHFPELTDQVKTEAKEEVKDELTNKGRQMERKRVVEIMDADAPRELTVQAIKEGTEAMEFYKLAWKSLDDEKKAEAKAKSEELASMAEGPAQESVVAQVPTETELELKDGADVEAVRRAQELMNEKEIPYSQALQEVLNQDPKLAEAYYASFGSEA